MRFAFKTSPQNTTWAQMLAVWQAADDIDVYESGWTFDHFYPIFSDSAGPCLEGWTTLTALAQACPHRPQGRAATAPADLHRRQRGKAHAADHRALRPALELRRRAARAVRAQARCAVRALRGHRT